METTGDWTRAQAYMTEVKRRHERTLADASARAETLAELLEILVERGDLTGQYAQAAIDNARRIVEA